jgi:hypothetical protein
MDPPPAELPGTPAPGSSAGGSGDRRVGKKYRLGRKIGSGSFGDVYLGTGKFILKNCNKMYVYIKTKTNSKWDMIIK